MGTFIIKKTNTGFNFSLIAANKQKIAVASQVYTTKSACKTGMASVGKNAARCIEENRIEDQTLKNPTVSTCHKFEIYFDKAGDYRYRLIATNGESIAISEEGYKSKNGCMNGIKSVAINAVDAEIIDETSDK
ncbi:MAG: YegP family protein [Clostridia bacterium]|nr:YegP family protein [Clostridia bacterium]